MITHPVIWRAEDALPGNLPASERGGAEGFFAATRGAGPSIGGFNDQPEKPDDGQCTTCGRSFVRSGTK